MVINQFYRNMERVKQIGALYLSLKEQIASALDLSDLLRLQIVLCASSLDYFIHEIVIVGIIESIGGKRTETVECNSLLTRHSVQPSSLNYSELETTIRQIHDTATFQRPNAITRALRLIYSGDIWSTLSRIMNKSPDQITRHLDLIIERRNRIAHEADLKPTIGGGRWPINHQSVMITLDFIQELVESIFNVIN